ncbi:ankyrin, partial [Coniochaeta ligniaria NRRL 30616]
LKESTVLHTAVWYGHRDATEYLLKAGADDRRHDHQGRTPLDIAVEAKNKALVDVFLRLLDIGADVTISDNQGQTPLHYAAKYDRPELELILQTGKCISQQDNYGHTPLHLFRMTAMDLAISGASRDSLEFLLHEAGLDTNLKDAMGRSLLSLAAEKGQVAVVEHLLESSPPLEEEDNLKRTALYWAAKGGNVDVVKLLVDHGANI